MAEKYIEQELKSNPSFFQKAQSGNFVDTRVLRHVVCNVNKPDGVTDEAFSKVLNAVAKETDLIPSMPLVRCIDCKYSLREDEQELWCNGFCSPARLVCPEDFCSHGCMKEGLRHG